MAGGEWSLPVSRNIIINQQYGADTIIHARERDKKQQEKKKVKKIWSTHRFSTQLKRCGEVPKNTAGHRQKTRKGREEEKKKSPGRDPDRKPRDYLR